MVAETSLAVWFVCQGPLSGWEDVGAEKEQTQGQTAVELLSRLPTHLPDALAKSYLPAAQLVHDDRQTSKLWRNSTCLVPETH